MYGLPEEVTKKFQKGLHVARLTDGYFNGLWSDMLIETTLMRFGSAPQGGLVGITLQPNSVIKWAYSFHKLSKMIKDFKELKDHSPDNRRHKEESVGRMKADLTDRENLRKKLDVCIDPIEETGDEFASGIVNIVSGKVVTDTNVYDCVKIGREQLVEFRSSLPEG